MDVTIETAKYILAHYSNLLTPEEQMVLRHHQSLLKLDGADERHYRMYLKIGRLTDKPEVLAYLSNGFEQFAINCAKRVLGEQPDEVYLNLCPNCGKLARTPLAKQCRFCGCDWH